MSAKKTELVIEVAEPVQNYPSPLDCSLGTPVDVLELRRKMELPPVKPCDHDFLFLRCLYAPMHYGERVDCDKDVFYCRKCLEYREVKR